MRLLAILFAVGAATLAFAALHETHAASTTYTRNVEQTAVAEQARDHEIARATHVAQVIAHTTGPLPFGLVPGAPPPTDVGGQAPDEDVIVDATDRCPDAPEENADDGCPDRPQTLTIEDVPPDPSVPVRDSVIY